MNIPRRYQYRMDRARQRRNILALGFREIDMHRPIHAGACTAHVYFAAREDLIKIGSSATPLTRTRALKAELIGVVPGVGPRFESFLHHYFEGFREHGEWFRAEAPLVAFIGRVNTLFPLDEQVAA